VIMNSVSCDQPKCAPGVRDHRQEPGINHLDIMSVQADGWVGVIHCLEKLLYLLFRYCTGIGIGIIWKMGGPDQGLAAPRGDENPLAPPPHYLGQRHSWGSFGCAHQRHSLGRSEASPVD